MIRAATLDDLPQLLRLGAAMHAESPRFSRLHFSAVRLEATLRALMDSPRGFVMVASADSGWLVGGMVAVAAPHWASDDLIATDLALFIAPAARGGLLPARLLSRYVQWARQLGAQIIQAGVTTGIEPETTARLYERMGLTRCGVILEA